MYRYYGPFDVHPADQKTVKRSGTNRNDGAGPPNKKPELPARTRYTTRIAASVDSVVPIHLNNTPRLAFAACCGPYSSAPWCIRITAIRLTMKVMIKTMTRPHTADPVITAAAIALAELEVTMRIEGGPTISAKTPKMMSRIRVT